VRVHVDGLGRKRGVRVLRVVKKRVHTPGVMVVDAWSERASGGEEMEG
jgi:hypothetical protein